MSRNNGKKNKMDKNMKHLKHLKRQLTIRANSNKLTLPMKWRDWSKRLRLWSKRFRRELEIHPIHMPIAR